MIARKQEIGLQLNQLIDALLLGGVFWICHLLSVKGLAGPTSPAEVPGFAHFLWMLAVIVPFAPFLLELNGFYNYQLDKSLQRSLSQIGQAGFWLLVVLGSASFLLRLEIPNFSVLMLFTLAAPATLLLKERLYIAHRTMRLRRGETSERIILAGERDSALKLLQEFSPSQRLEIQVVDIVDLECSGSEILVNAVHRHNVGRVILTFSQIEPEKVQRAIKACEIEGVEVWLSADFIHTSVARPAFESLGKRPMLVFRSSPDLSWALLLKNTADCAIAAVGLIVLAPLLAIIALAVKLTSSGPVIFSQQRAGIHGKPFTMLKFRTMLIDAEDHRSNLLGQNEMRGPVFKIERDPRLTPVGRWLRRTSLDELPQLLNVLLGDMSLVGPRPLPLYEVDRFDNAAYRRRLSMKPGLACLWQIRGRNNVTNFEDWVRMDLEYIDHWSLSLDLLILLRTIPAVLAGAGAK
ncbi:MAG TPA: sugar transferase [Terrimicrobiaceae bacterium]|nr:sugar transferase [Terrimicrobiaceae bacterium]